MKLRKLAGVLLSMTMLFGGSTAVFADTETEQPDALEAGSGETDTGNAEEGTGEPGTDSGSASMDTETEGTESNSKNTGDSSGTEGTEPGTGNTESGTDSTDSSTDTGTGNTESTDSGTESSESGTDSTESGTESTDSNTGSTDSGTDSGTESTKSTDGKKEDADKVKDKTDSKKDSTDSKTVDAKKKEEEKKKEEKDDKDKAASSTTSASTVRRTYIPPSPTTITKSEFTLVGKVAMKVSTKEVHLNIRNARSKEGRIIAKLEDGCTVYCLSNPTDEWAYIETIAKDGTIVRGYCKTEYIVTAPEGTEETPEKVIPRCKEEENEAFKDYLTTTQQSLVDRYEVTTTVYGAAASGDAEAIISYGEQFIGTPYAYASESLTGGTDCSGFTQGVFGAFGISLPRTAADQAECGMKVAVSDLVPGDLVFYRSDNSVMDDRAPNGVTHVMIYLGNSQVLHASSSAGQVTISDINLDSICWGVRLLNGSSITKAADKTGTLLSDILETAEKAKDGDKEARKDVIEILADACEEEWQETGLAPSVMIADAVWTTDWLAGTKAGATSNNVYDMPAEALDTLWDSNWDKKEADGYRLYDTIEEAVNDQASFKVSLHPYIEGETDVDVVLESAYAEDKEDIGKIIEEYDLEQYDTVTRAASVGGTVHAAADSASYTYDEMEILCATVAQECDSSYEGALAVISCMMNRADMNYGGYGTTAFAQATATGEWAWDMPGHEDWHDYCIARMQGGFGGIPDHVRQAVSDCLSGGVRNHPYTNMYSSHEKAEAATGRVITDYAEIGTNCFFS